MPGELLLHILEQSGHHLTYEIMNRHFAKNDLPRIQYANPTVDIEVHKVLKAKEETWKPEMVIELSA